MKPTASLQVKNDIYQVVINYKDIYGKRHQKGTSTGLKASGNNKRLANQKMYEILMEFKKNIENVDSKTSNKLFISYLKEWLLTVKNTLEENTYDSYKTIIDKTCKFFGRKNIALDKLKPADIQEFYNSLYSQNLTGNTVLHYHNVIRNALEKAMKLDLIMSTPADRIERPKRNNLLEIIILKKN